MFTIEGNILLDMITHMLLAVVVVETVASAAAAAATEEVAVDSDVRSRWFLAASDILELPPIHFDFSRPF